MKKINFADFTKKLKELNPKEYYDWPFPIHMGVGVLVMIGITLAGAIFHLSPLKDELGASVDKELKLKEEFVDKKKQAINLPLYEKQLDEITKDSDTLLKQLPDKSQMEKLLIDINQAAIGRGLQVELFKPGKEKLNEFYAELPVEIKMSGTYQAIGNFTSDTSQLSRVVLFSDMDISTKNGVVSLTALVKTFRYLDADELAAQAKKKLEEKMKNKKKKE